MTKTTLDWNTQGTCRKGRPKITWKRPVVDDSRRERMDESHGARSEPNVMATFPERFMLPREVRRPMMMMMEGKFFELLHPVHTPVTEYKIVERRFAIHGRYQNCCECKWMLHSDLDIHVD